MKNLEGKNLDDFFRKELSSGDIQFNEAHWLRLEKRLKKNTRRRIVAWITTSGIAAMLLLALSVSYIFNEKTEPVAAVKKKALERTQPHSSAAPENTDDNPANTPPEPRAYVYRGVSAFRISKKAQVFDDAVSSTFDSEYSAALARVIEPVPESENTAVLNSPENTVLSDSVSPATAQETVQPSPEELVVKSEVSIPKTNDALAKRGIEEPSIKASAFSVTLLAGPDVSGVNTFQSTQIGLNAGLIVNYQFSKKLSVSTGAVYAMKIYDAAFKYYKPNSTYIFPSSPLSVDADCRVLDIPLNINYTALSRKQDALSFSSGISSYLMLNEVYKFSYENPASRGPRRYSLDNGSKHFLGVLNFAASYERKISDEVRIGFQPYAKVPLADIGYGNVKLLSTGITTSVKLALPSKAK